MRKNKSLIKIFATASLSTLLGVSLLHASFIKPVKGESIKHSVTLNSGNKVTSSGNHQMVTAEGNDITYTYSNVASSTSGHVTLNNGGSVVNKDILTSIDTFTAVFSGSLQAKTSYDSNTWSNYFDLSSGVKYELPSNPYFIQFYANNGQVTIDSIKYTYTCSPNPIVDIGGGDTYKLVTDLSQVDIGDSIIFTNKDATKGLANQDTYYRKSVSVTTKANGLALDNYTGATIFSVGSGSITNTYSLMSNNKYLYANSSSYNNLREGTNLQNTSSWVFEPKSDNVYTVTAQGSYTNSSIFYDEDSEMFKACPKSNSDAGVKIYVLGVGGPDAPKDEIGFTATNSKAATYKTSDSFNKNDLVVKALFSDNTSETLTSGFAYEIRNSSNELIDINEPFGYAGTYSLKVTYKNYVPVIIPLTVSGERFIAIKSVSLKGIDGSYVTSDTFSSVFDLANISCEVTYSDDTKETIPYSGFSAKELTLSLMNPTGLGHEMNVPFGVEGTWSVKVTYGLNSTVCDTKTFTVEAINIQTITLNETEVTIEADGTIQLIVESITPVDATYKTYTWSSNNTSVATVDDNGLVTGVAPGNAIISATATDSGKVSGTCSVTVVPTKAVTYTFTSKSWETETEDWISGKDGGQFLNNGIQVTSSGGIVNGTSPKSFSNVTKVTVTYCTNSTKGAGSITVSVGGTAVDTLSVTSTGGTSARELVFNAEGSVSGSVKIEVTCTTNSIYIMGCKIETGEPVYPTDIALAMDSTVVGVGSTATIKVSCTPSDTNVTNFTWSTSNSTVATVSDGIVTGKAVGTATITCKAEGKNGTITKTIAIEVKAIAVTGVTISPKTLLVSKGGTGSVSATVAPSNATNKSVTYTSSNTSVATVDNSGKVTGVAAGTATIKVKTVDGEKTDTCSVTVNVPTVNKTVIRETYQDLHANYAYDCDATPTTANPKILIIPIWFNDSASYITKNKDQVRTDIGKAYLGTDSETGWKSVKTYYETLSNGTTSLNGTLADWYNVNKNAQNVTGDDTVQIVKDATNNYFNTHSSDKRSNYDTDGNGYLDGVILIYAAPDYSEYERVKNLENTNDNLWAYCYWMQNETNPSTSNPTPNTFFWASYDFMYSPSLANANFGTSYGGGDTSHCIIDSHTFIHEMGHCFGIDDYYDYGDKRYSPAGGFSMQDCNVGCHDPYSIMSWGWADPFIPKQTMTIELHPFQTTRELILLTPSWNSYDSPFDEYLLLELYTPTGLNKFDVDNSYCGYQTGPTATGIRLWHVDSRLAQYVYKNNDWEISEDNLSTTVSGGDKLVAASNTYDDGEEGYGSVFSTGSSSDWYYFNLLQLIRNSTTANYTPSDWCDNADLFRDGSSFNMTTYGKQFRKQGKLNSNINLGWSFSVSITGSGDSAVAKVTCTKA